MSSDRSTAPGEKTTPLRMLSRLGVASRLLLAFLGISGLAMVGAGVAIFSFREIGDVLDRITARRVPAALASQEVSRQANVLSRPHRPYSQLQRQASRPTFCEKSQKKWKRFPHGWTSSKKAAPKAPRLA